MSILSLQPIRRRNPCKTTPLLIHNLYSSRRTGFSRPLAVRPFTKYYSNSSSSCSDGSGNGNDSSITNTRFAVLSTIVDYITYYSNLLSSPSLALTNYNGRSTINDQLYSTNRTVSSNDEQTQQQPKTKYSATKLPIVLCHGLFGYDKLGFEAVPMLQIRYWGEIYDNLEKAGAKVYIARVPATGNIEERAYYLKKFLNEKCAGQDVNLVSHSMGGLDSRYLISHLERKNFTVRSLTTLSTPHRGSPVMDWIRDNIGIGKQNLENVESNSSGVNRLLAKLINAVDAPAYSNLTTDFLTQHFNPSTPNSQTVRYFSYGASIENVHPVSLLWLPHQIVSQREGLNDGIVSVYSSRWGEFLGTVNADHFELNKRRASGSYSRSIIPSSFNFPLLNFLRLRYLWDVAALTQPILSSLPIPLKSKQQQQQQQDQSLKPEQLYQKRLKAILNRIHGPQSIDDFIYGYDQLPELYHHTSSHPSSKKAYDSVEFYLKVMDRLAKEGF